MNTSNESDPLDDQVMDEPVDATPEGEIADVDFQTEAAKQKDLAQSFEKTCLSHAIDQPSDERAHC